MLLNSKSLKIISFYLRNMKMGVYFCMFPLYGNLLFFVVRNVKISNLNIKYACSFYKNRKYKMIYTIANFQISKITTSTYVIIVIIK